LSVSGEGSWVKSIASMDDTGNIRMMVVNYDQKSSHTESVPLRFENLPKMTFKYIRKDFMGATKTQQIATSEANWKTTELFAPNTAAMISLEF
jgi:hypothetical protein